MVNVHRLRYKGTDELTDFGPKFGILARILGKDNVIQVVFHVNVIGLQGRQE
jgi:hypothetical protein